MTSSTEGSHFIVALDGFRFLCKYILIVFNLVFMVVGLASLVFGLWLNFLDNRGDMFDVDYPDDNKESIDLKVFYIAVYILVTVGSVMVALGIFGEFATCNEKKNPLILFCVLLMLLAVAEITVGALAYTGRDKVGRKLGELYVDLYKLYERNKEEAITAILTSLHSSLYCCGVTGVPLIEGVRETCPKEFYSSGCPKTIGTLYNNKASLVMGCFFGIGALLIGQVICSALLSSKIQRDPDHLP